MAGEWIKMRTNLWDDPRVSRIVDMTGKTEATIVGGLYWLWATADEHTESGLLHGLSVRQIDRKTGIAKFGAALVEVGWLQEEAEGVRIVHFDEHNGVSAKKRAQTAKRVANHRIGNDDETQTGESGNAPSVTGALAREEEDKRKDKDPPATPPRAQAHVREDGRFPMATGWSPSETLPAMLHQAGLLSPGDDAINAAVAEFVAFWSTKPDEVRTQAEWDRAFLKNLKRAKVEADSRSAAAPTTPRRQSGRHHGINDADFREGVSDDGRF